MHLELLQRIKLVFDLPVRFLPRLYLEIDKSFGANCGANGPED